VSDPIRYRLEDAITEVANDLVGTLVHRAFQEYGIVVTDKLQKKLVDEICFASKRFGA